MKTIQPNSTKFVFQTFTDDKNVTKEYRKNKVHDPLATWFTCGAEEAAARLQVLQSKGAGCFIQLNEGTQRGKANITALSAYFLDTDGAPLGPIKTEMPTPSALVESSPNNFHIYWKTTDSMEKFKPTQKKLAERFACDEAMVNLDRVVRLPGTWHLKNPEAPFQCKLKLGASKLYSASELLNRIKIQGGSTNFAEAMMVSESSSYELPKTLPEGGRTHHLISLIGQLSTQGYSEGYIKTQVKKEMLARLPAGQSPIDDDTLELEIYPAISKFIQEDTQEDVRKKAPSPPPPDLKHSPSLPEEEEEVDAIDKFLEALYYVEDGQKVVHVRKDDSWKVLKLDEFKVSYGNIKRGGKSMAKMWLEHPDRATVRRVQYHPCRGRTYKYKNELMINNYEGTDLEVIEQAHPAQIEPFLEHIRYLFPEQQAAELFLNWMAITVRQPDVRIPWSPFIISDEGRGKGWLYELLKRLLGEQNCATIGPNDLQSGFNEYMFEKTLVLLDELKIAGRSKFDLVETMKPLITNPDVAVNIKFGAKGTFPTFVNFLAYSNHTNAIPIPEHDRRWWVWRVTAEKQTPAYYTKLFDWLSTDGPAHVLAWLRARDVGEFTHSAPPPMTKAKREMTEAFKSEVEKLLEDAVEDRYGPFVADVVSKDILEDFVQNHLKKDRLDKGDSLQIKQFIITRCSKYQVAERIRAAYIKQGDNRKYPVILRNPDKWCNASIESVTIEMERAWKVNIGQQPGAALALVTDN